MTTLTERLRELEANANDFCDDEEFLGKTLNRVLFCESVALAQELHALLVECGEAFSNLEACDDGEGVSSHISEALTKLKQAGIV